MVRTLSTLLGCCLVAGAVAGLGDVALSTIQGRMPHAGIWAWVLSASLGAGLAVLALLIPTGLLAVLPRPRAAAGKLSFLFAAFLVSPGVVALGRTAYKRVPWDAGDAAILAAGALGLAAAVFVLGRGLVRVIGRRGDSLAGFFGRAALPMVLLLLPAAIRVGPALFPPRATRDGASGVGNLLLLSVDTLRADRVGVLGDPRARTPWMDRLARRSVVYPECVTPSPWTLPSLGSLLTGTYPGEHRILESLSEFDAAVPTLAEACREEGLRTAAFVSNPWLTPGSLARGFDTFDVAERLECVWALRGSRIYSALSKALLRGFELDSAPRLSSNAMAWLDSADGDWFLWLHYFDPHLPNWPAPPWIRMFGPMPRHVGSSLTVEEIRAGDFPGGEEGRAEIDRLYEAEVAWTDHGLGQVLRHVELRGERDNTAIVFTVDHGEEFWDHQGYGHGHEMFDEVLRVPLFVSPPGGTAGRLDPGLTSLIDVAPTALAAAGLANDELAFSGRNRIEDRAVPITYGEATLYGDEQKYLRSPEWKLVYRPRNHELALYDLWADPAERLDVAATQPAVRDSLFQLLSAWIVAFGSEGSMAARDPAGNVDPATLELLKALGYTP